jgi:hypothetical protein
MAAPGANACAVSVSGATAGVGVAANTNELSVRNITGHLRGAGA